MIGEKIDEKLLFLKLSEMARKLVKSLFGNLPPTPMYTLALPSIDILCSRCSSLSAFDNKWLTAIRVHFSVLYVLLGVPTPVNISLTIAIRASYFCLRKSFLSGGYVVAVIFELLVAKRTIALTEVTRVKRAR